MFAVRGDKGARVKVIYGEGGQATEGGVALPADTLADLAVSATIVWDLSTSAATHTFTRLSEASPGTWEDVPGDTPTVELAGYVGYLSTWDSLHVWALSKPALLAQAEGGSMPGRGVTGCRHVPGWALHHLAGRPHHMG